MHLVTLRFVNRHENDGDDGDPNPLRAAFEQLEAEGDPIEHLCFRAGPDGVNVGLFLAARNDFDAREIAERIGLKVGGDPSVLRDWRYLECI